MMQDLSDTEFQNLLATEAGVPILAEFWAEWCAPCKNLNPILEQLSERYTGRMRFVRLNADDTPDSVKRYAVRSLPTIILFRDGQPAGQINGLQPEPVLVKNISGVLAPGGREG